MKRKISAWLLSFVLCLGMLSTAALAEDVTFEDGGLTGAESGTTQLVIDGKVEMIIDVNEDGSISEDAQAAINSALNGNSTVQITGSAGLVDITKPDEPAPPQPEDPKPPQPQQPEPVDPWPGWWDDRVPSTPRVPSSPEPVKPAPDPEPETPAEPAPRPLPFTDVKESDWFFGAVRYVYDEGIMGGDGSESTFNPHGRMTRAMVWTVLGRLSGADVSGTGSGWYAKAQAWAISAGVSDGTNPNGSITREELVTMLWRYAGNPVAQADLSVFSDGAAVSGWAEGAVQWAVSTGLLQGDGGRLNSGGTATRAEVATILMRYCEIIA